MSEQSSSGTEDDELGVLFDEYLDGWVDGSPPDLAELARRAGPRAGELRGQAALLAELGELNALLEVPTEAAAPHIERVSHFQIVHKIGESASSRVFRARDSKLGRDVALKVLKSESVAPGDASAWVRKEGRSLARLKHPSVVHVYEAEVADGVAYLAMEHVDGPSLFDVLAALRARAEEADVSTLGHSAVRAADRLAPLASRCRLVLLLARALAACHELGIVHRDVKPGNVLLDREGVPKLIDFGLAHDGDAEGSLHHTTNLYGTLPYLAPEQIEHQRTGASPASDQYALGLVLYELVTLRHPFVRSGNADTWRAVARAEIEPPRALRRDVPTDLERICMHCLEREPSKRYGSMEDLAKDLEAFLEHRAVSLPEPALGLRVWKAIRRHRVRAAAIATGALVALIALVDLGIGRSERTHLIESLRARHSAAIQHADPEAFTEFFADAWLARGAAKGFDGALLAGSLLPHTVEELDGLCASGSEALHAKLESEYEIEPVTGWDRATDDRARALRETWFAATRFEALSSPAGHCDGFGHDVGTVSIPRDARLLRYRGDALPAFPSLEEVPSDVPLRAGLYRCAFGSGPSSSECEFLTFPFRPRFELRPIAVGVDIATRTVRCREQTFELASAYRDAHYRVGPFRILRGPVMLSDLELAFDKNTALGARTYSEQQANGKSEEFPVDLPAVIEWATAMQCAARLGGRLPTAAELWSALLRDDVEPIEGFQSEWVSAFWGKDPERVYRLEYAESLAPGAKTPKLDESSHDGLCAGTGFRLVFPAED